MIVYVKAELERIWMETGEIDVSIDVGGEDVVLTVNPKDVTGIAQEHTSSCDLSDENYKFCTCGVLPFRAKQSKNIK